MTVGDFTKNADMAINLIDLERYPMANLDNGEGAAFLTQCQQHINEHGWCSLEGFIRPDAIAALSEEANAMLETAEVLTIKRTIYQGDADPSAAEGDPRWQEYEHQATQLADDQISVSTLIKQLYHSDVLTEFVRRVQGKKELYRCADQFQALNIVALQPDSWHAWHYDTTECTVTLLLQAAEHGGEFAFIPDSRTDETEDHEAVNQLLAGDLSVAQSFPRGAGTFTFFHGGYSLHGVTRVEGNSPRVSAILTYDEQPGVTSSDEINIRVYGARAEQILMNR